MEAAMLSLIEKKKALVKEKRTADEFLRCIEHDLKNIENELVHLCANSCEGHQFNQVCDGGIYGDTFYICTVCGHEQL